MLRIIHRGSALAAGLALSIGAAPSGAPQVVRPDLSQAAAAQDDDQRAIERAIRDSIGWASTKDRALLESVLARDERLFMFQPESTSTVAGWTQFARQFDFWMDPRFKATTFEIRDLRIDRSRSGDVAWWSCMLDDFGEWDGRPIGWKDARWTGVLEKRDGRWVIAQMHFSFAADTVRAEAGRFPELSGPYLGQKPPGPTPEIFAPGIISTGRFERDVAMSPGGDEMYFGASGPGYLYTTVLATRLVNGRWTEPEIVPHLDDPRHLNLEPALSPDGSRLFFLSTRPNAAAGAARNQDIWVMTKTADGWSEPENLGAPVNTDLAEYFPSITRDNTIYFTREEPGSRVSHIWRARLAGGRYQAAEKLPAQVNSGRSQFNAFIAPDESYLIVPVDGRDDSIGGCDYYVVFRTPDDRWSEPINLGPTVNSEGSQEFSPYVSPDGKYFFYMATRLDRPERLSYQLIRDLHGRPRNGNADIYWVDAGVVTSLRSKAVFK